jgi:hypothetical protein
MYARASRRVRSARRRISPRRDTCQAHREFGDRSWGWRSTFHVPPSSGPEVLLQGLAPGRYDVVAWTTDGRALRAEGIEAPAVDAVIVVQ